MLTTAEIIEKIKMNDKALLYACASGDKLTADNLLKVKKVLEELLKTQSMKDLF